MSGTPRPPRLHKLHSKDGLCQAIGVNARVAAGVLIAQTPDVGVHLDYLVRQSREVIREAAPGEKARDFFGYPCRTADTSDIGTCEINSVR